MFVGHVGVGLALKKIDKDLNAGWLIGASLLNDVILWSLAIVGVEQVTIPADFADKHYLSFDFPYSHSLLFTVLRAAIVFAIAYLFVKKHRRLLAGIAVGSAVILHWICDLLEHVPDLPLAGASSTKFGFGLWNQMPVALAIEVLLAILGVIVYFCAATQISSVKKWGMAALVLLIAILTVYGGLASPPPPGVTALAVSSLATNLLVIAVAFWLDRPRTIH